jgi:SAM-dependent methyltransferase
MAVVEKVAEIVVSHRPQVVLDLGCGDGRMVQELLDAGVPRVCGVDPSERAILFARAFNFGRDCRWYADVSDESVPPVDAAVAVDVLEHIPDEVLPDVISRLADRLPKGGVFVVSVPTLNLPLNRKHFRHYDLEILRAQLAQDFDVESVYYIHRLGLYARAVEGFVRNRLYTMNTAAGLWAAKAFYDRFVRTAKAKNAAQLLATFEKRL